MYIPRLFLGGTHGAGYVFEGDVCDWDARGWRTGWAAVVVVLTDCYAEIFGVFLVDVAECYTVLYLLGKLFIRLLEH